MAEQQTAPAGGSLSDILRGIWRRKLFVLTLWLLGSAAGYAISQLIDPVYQTESQVLIGNADIAGERSVGQSATVSRDAVADERAVQSELAVLSSNDLAMRVIKQLDLTKLPGYNAQLKPKSSTKDWAIRLGFADDPATFTPEQLALEEYRSIVSIYPLPDSNVIGIKLRSDDPQNAALVANTIAETYVRSTQELQAQNTDETKLWLERQIKDLRTKVSAAEADVERFRVDKGLVEAQNATLNEQEISAVNAQITAAEAAEAEAVARAQEIKDLLASSGSVDTSSEVLGSSIVSGLRDRQLAAQQRISELSATYLDSHPKMIAARSALRDVERQIRREALKIVDSLDGQASVAAKQANGLRKKLQDLKSDLAVTGQDEARLKELEREATASRALLENLLTRYADANARTDVSVKPPYARIIQRADVPASIYFPKKGPLVFLASLAGLLTGLGIAFLAEMMRAAARLSAMQSNAPHAGTERRSETPDRRMGGIPRERLQQPSINVAPSTEAGSVVRVQQPTRANGAPPPPAIQVPQRSQPIAPIAAVPASIAPPPVQPKDPPPRDKSAATTADTAIQLGDALIKLKSDYKIFTSRFSGQTKFKTDVALFVVATARAIAEQQKKVLVIDADPTSHALEPLFDLEQSVGLSDLVAGGTDFTKIIRKDSQSSTHVISYGNAASQKIDSAVAERMPSILANLEDIYDVVLVHAGDATPATTQMLLGCKSVVLIVPQNEQRDLATAEQEIHDLGAESVMHVTLMQETILS